MGKAAHFSCREFDGVSLEDRRILVAENRHRSKGWLWAQYKLGKEG